MVSIAEEAAAKAEAAGISVEVARPAHADAVRHRRRPGVGQEDRPLRDRPRGAEDLRLRRRADRVDPGSAIEYLEAPILRVAGFDTPFPYTLEHEYMPNADRVLGAIRQTLEW
jgi:hypothetical protein